jgi:hypothetical protein
VTRADLVYTANQNYGKEKYFCFRGLTRFRQTEAIYPVLPDCNIFPVIPG